MLMWLCIVIYCCVMIVCCSSLVFVGFCCFGVLLGVGLCFMDLSGDLLLGMMVGVGLF